MQMYKCINSYRSKSFHLIILTKLTYFVKVFRQLSHLVIIFMHTKLKVSPQCGATRLLDSLYIAKLVTPCFDEVMQYRKIIACKTFTDDDNIFNNEFYIINNEIIFLWSVWNCTFRMIFFLITNKLIVLVSIFGGTIAGGKNFSDCYFYS